MQAYIGAIWSFGFNFAPYGWALCDGSLLPISQNEALYSLIGTTYGGDGQSSFGLPNLQGRVPIGAGQGAGLPNYVIGQAGGSESVTLTVNNLPPHNHPVLTANLPVSAVNGESADPTNNAYGLANTAAGNPYNSVSTTGVTMAVSNGVTGSTGSSIPVDILNPFVTVNYCIAVLGIFPSRN